MKASRNLTVPTDSRSISRLPMRSRNPSKASSLSATSTVSSHEALNQSQPHPILEDVCMLQVHCNHPLHKSNGSLLLVDGCRRLVTVSSGKPAERILRTFPVAQPFQPPYCGIFDNQSHSALYCSATQAPICNITLKRIRSTCYPAPNSLSLSAP